MITIKDMYDELPKFVKGNTEYVKMLDIKAYLEQHFEVQLVGGLIVPFYITNKGTYELLFYELYIRDGLEGNDLEWEEYVLPRTGKSDLSEVPPELLEYHQHYFVDISKENNKEKLLGFLEHLVSDAKVIENVLSIFGEFSMEHVYFEFLF